MIIYDDQMSVIKAPVSAKDDRFVISTGSWKAGVYIAKVTLGDRILYGKFVVGR